MIRRVLLTKYVRWHNIVHQKMLHLPTRQSWKGQDLRTPRTFAGANKTLWKCVSHTQRLANMKSGHRRLILKICLVHTHAQDMFSRISWPTIFQTYFSRHFGRINSSSWRQLRISYWVTISRLMDRLNDSIICWKIFATLRLGMQKKLDATLDVVQFFFICQTSSSTEWVVFLLNILDTMLA